MDTDAIATSLLLAWWINLTVAKPADTNAATDDFEATVTAAANFACPQLARHKRAVVHWWTGEIAEHRRKCCACRRSVKLN